MANWERAPLVAATIWLDEARKTAKQRRDQHSSLGNQRHWGKPKDYHDEFFGSLGQIAFREHAQRWEVPCEFAPLFHTIEQLKSQVPWDAKINGHTVEVKTVPPNTWEDGRIINRRFLLVKKEEMHDSEFYVAVRFFDSYEYVFAGYATLDEVLGAKIFEKYAPAHAIPLTDLHPLSIEVFK